MDSILLTIKQMVGLSGSYAPFDVDVIVSINTAIMVLEQLGVCKDGFSITGPNETWSDLVPDIKKLEGVKTYIYVRVKLEFDPPANATLRDILEKTKSELEWRLNVKAEQIDSDAD